MPYKQIDLKKVKTYPIARRHNLVKLSDLVHPGGYTPTFDHPDLEKIIELILKARQGGHPVVWMMGAHVIKSGLGPLLIDLLDKGVVTHVAGNGAVSIHDTELALIGETSEDVASSIEDGSFGMADETSRVIHKALKEGVLAGMGYGEAVGCYIAKNGFLHKDVSVLYNAYRLGIPLTIHPTFGADIIHQHPECDFGIMGEAAGIDFRVFCESIANLEQGVFLNFGSAVTGAEVFLKALSIGRNLGYPVSRFTTVNFDIIPLAGDYHAKVGNTQPEYYYRPRKNIINRPVSMGGQGFHIQGNHQETVPSIHHRLLQSMQQEGMVFNIPIRSEGGETEKNNEADHRLPPACAEILQEFLVSNPHLGICLDELLNSFRMIAASLERGGTLFLVGNGGSMSDALHISGEMLKSYTFRHTANLQSEAVVNLPDGELLQKNLESGLRAVTLGINPVLRSAVENDFQDRDMAPAQELNVLARLGDVLLGISTSGKARNVILAVETAKIKGVHTILFTGPAESILAGLTDVVVRSPAKRTDRIQEDHIRIYHCLCEMLEVYFFKEK